MEKDRLLEGHQDNDGIREYDNPLPDWFLYLFYATVVYAFLHSAYTFGHGWAIARAGGVGQNLSSSGGEYLAAIHRSEQSGPPRFRAPQGEELRALLKTPTAATSGQAVFQANCAACHGNQGQGVVGPNLTDDYWLHGGGPEALVASVANGYPAKGMPAWKPVLGAEKVHQAAAYVMTLRGRNVPNPKAPQGEKEP